MDSKNRVTLVAVLVVGIAVGAVVGLVASQNPATDSTDRLDRAENGTDRIREPFVSTSEQARLTQFSSKQAFVSYVRQGQLLGDTRFGRPVSLGGIDIAIAQPAVEADAAGDAAGGNGASESRRSAEYDLSGTQSKPDRVSSTNVQEKGLSEPDILKTDDEHVYYALGEHRDETGGQTSVISAAQPADPEQIASIDTNGRMLLAGDDLVVIEKDRLVGYDVTDPKQPERQWTKQLNHSVVTARLYSGQLYLVTKESVSLSHPCPVEPIEGTDPIRCTEIYHPTGQTPVDATYSALVIDPASGEVESSASFVGTSDNTAVYMSENALYVTYTQPANRGNLRIDFLTEQQRDRLPDRVIDRLEEIRGYNISARTKLSEVNRVLHRWYQSLDDQKRERIETNIRNDYRNYLSSHQRELVRTGIVQLGIDSGKLSVQNVETVPGRPLNQFSLDEHNGTVRITTTIPATGGKESRNDLYVLDSDDLSRMGSAQNMGVNERVYSVRYVGDTAYVVTFRRVDPFHVVDLSDPTDPTEVGKLKLPGFSSYLHPVDENHVLGIGEEDGEVKAVLFDVSNPSNPTIDDDYILDADWSAVSQSHHAFLLDRQHEVFFLPTEEGGNIISYSDGSLELKSHVSTGGGPALRAMYINDYMYVFGENELTVVDEQSWERTQTVPLD